MSHQYVSITVGLLFLIIFASFFFLSSSVNKMTGFVTNCHTTPLWDWKYCSITCKCDAGEGDCDINTECNTGYCHHDVGPNYGKVILMDVCENMGAPTTTIPSGGGGGGSGPDNDWVISGNDIYSGVSGNVGIGTANPSQKLDVIGYVKGSSGLCIGNDCRTSWPSGGAPTTTSTTTTRPPITTPAESFDDGLDGYVSIENYINWACGGGVAGSCSAKYPGYCYEYTSATCPKTYEARCAAGWNLVQVFVSPATTSRGDNILYSCYKAPTNFCGNSIIDSGETCDDGNTINDSGSCSSDCKRINYFDILISPIISCDNRYYYNYVYSNDLSADQACKEQGFTKSARYSFFKGYSPVICKWNGANWEALYDTRYSQGYYIHDLWCE